MPGMRGAHPARLNCHRPVDVAYFLRIIATVFLIPDLKGKEVLPKALSSRLLIHVQTTQQGQTTVALNER